MYGIRYSFTTMKYNETCVLTDSSKISSNKLYLEIIILVVPCLHRCITYMLYCILYLL